MARAWKPLKDFLIFLTNKSAYLYYIQLHTIYMYCDQFFYKYMGYAFNYMLYDQFYLHQNSYEKKF